MQKIIIIYIRTISEQIQWLLRKIGLQELFYIWVDIKSFVISRPLLKKISFNQIKLLESDLLVFSCVRNEVDRLPLFLDYYRSKGVNCFFLIDNGSNDGTVDFLLSQSDVCLYQTFESYATAGCGVTWLQILLKKYGVGKWCLLVDIDEIFIYPNVENVPIKPLCQFLESENKNGLRATMLDMYADGFPCIKKNSCKKLWEIFPYFDKDTYVYQMPEKADVIKDFVRSPIWAGGVCHRVFKMKITLHKMPLFKFNKSMRLVVGPHFISNVDISTIEAILLHFKFDSFFEEKIKLEAKREEHWNNAYVYKGYKAILDHSKDLNLFSADHSILFKNSQQLVELSLMKTTALFDLFCTNEKVN